MIKIRPLALLALVLFSACADDARYAFGSKRRVSPRIESLRAAADDPAKRRALDRLARAFADSDRNTGGQEALAAVLAGAERNLGAVEYTGVLIARLGFHTDGLLAVAAAAARAKLELPEFRDLVELAVLRLSGGGAVLDLADRAAAIGDPAELPALRQEIAALRASAECATVEEAARTVAKLEENLAGAIKSP
jgi:hypothetical protein